MFVLFISFIFVLILSVGQTKDHKNVPLKDKLTQSLRHLKDILVNIEGKIEHERKILSQINFDLNRKHNPADLSIDCAQVISIGPIRRKAENLPAPAESKPGSRMAEEYSGITEALSETTDADYVKVEKLTTKKVLFIQDLKNTMKVDNHNYVSAFLTKFMFLLLTKPTRETMPVLDKMKFDINQRELDQRTVKSMGEDLIAYLRMYRPILYTIPPDHIKDQASWLYCVLKQRDTVIPQEHRNMIDFYGNKFTEADGEELFKALEYFNDFPNGNKSAEEVSALMVEAILSPHIIEEDSLEHETTIKIAKKIKVQKNAPIERRSMNYETNVKHFLLKHVNIEKIKQHHKNVKKNKHKIREASSYSDEEDHLRHNLYDALRHGNRTFVSYRKSDGGVNNEKTLRDLSSETDDEWVLKKNIYKVFE